MDRPAISAAADALEAARAAGVHLRVDGQHLLLDAPAPPPPAVLDLLRQHKAEILTLLRAARGEWSLDDWRAFFDERASVAGFEGGQTRPKAEETALECCIAEWLNRHPQRSVPGKCARCGQPERDGRAVVPFGTEIHTWLHAACWHDWYRGRREQARRTLLTFGLGSTVPNRLGQTPTT